MPPAPPQQALKYMKDVLQRNNQWATQKWKEDPTYFPGLAKGQAPKVVWIGCSDSRVPIETLGGFEPGEVFVHRNIANIVHPTDLSVQSILQFAVDVLNVQHIVICGHTKCGGIAAACCQQDHGSLGNWIRGIRDVARLHHDEIADLPHDKLIDRMIELNVIEQARNVIKTGVIQASRAKKGHDNIPSIHGYVFEVETGHLRPVPLGLAEWGRKYGSLYCMHEGAFEQLERDDAIAQELLAQSKRPPSDSAV